MNADNTHIFAPFHVNLHAAEQCIHSDLSNIYDFLIHHGLHINYRKSIAVLFGATREVERCAIQIVLKIKNEYVALSSKESWAHS